MSIIAEKLIENKSIILNFNLAYFMTSKEYSTDNNSVDALQIFFEDVARTSVINGKEDYLPLLRRIRRANTLHKLVAGTHEATFDKVIKKILQTVNEFNQQCQTLGKQVLDLKKLAIEIESFSENFQQDIPPTLAKSLARKGWQQEDEAITQFIDLGWRCVYLLWLLPHCMRSLHAPYKYSQEVELLFEQIQNDGKVAKKILVEGTIRYVINIAYHYVGKGVPYLDLIQEGTLGLIRAADLFNEHKGVHFQVYAATWIRQHITRCIADTSRLVRVPVHMHDEIAEIKEKIGKKLIQQNNTPVPRLDLFVAADWLTEAESTEIRQLEYKIQLQKQVQEYQRVFNFCNKSARVIVPFRWPSVFGLYSASQQLQMNTGKISSLIEVLDSMDWFAGEEYNLIGELAPNNLELSKIIPRTTNLKNIARQKQRNRLRNENIPLHLWPQVIKLENIQWKLTKLNGIEPSSLQVFQAAGWLTEEDVALLKQHQSSKHTLALSAETKRKLAKARQRMQYYQIASAVHFSLESTIIQCLPNSDTCNIGELLVAESSLKDIVDFKDLANTISDALSNLSSREREVVVLRLGLEDGQEHTLEEVGQSFSITRERVRQIEAKALRKLKHPLRVKNLEIFTDFGGSEWEQRQNYQMFLLRSLDFVEQSLNDEDYIVQEKKVIENFIQQYITRGRRKIWDTRRQSSRAELFREILETLGQPAHYSEIHEKALEIVPESLQFSKKITYTTLFYRTDYFRPFENATFGLSSWSANWVQAGSGQIFQHCPTPLLPSNYYVTSFFESIMVGRGLLQRSSLTASQFLIEMTGWAKRSTLTIPEGQNAFDAWYAAGLLKPVDLLSDSDSIIELTISTDAKLQDVRKHCLNALCQRIIKMPELLLTLERIARPTLSSIQKVLFGGERSGFDLSTRLDILAAFEAIQSDNGEWRLTDLGRAILETNPPQELPDFGEIEAFQESNEPATQIEWDEELGLLEI